MVDKLNLEQIVGLADSGDFDNVPLLATSTVVLLTALQWYGNLENWEGASYTLTDTERDEIDEIIGLIVAELQE